MFRFLAKSLLFLLPLLLIALPCYLLVYGLQAAPLVLSAEQMTPEDVSRARVLIKQNDPRRLTDGQVGQVLATERDLNLVLNYLLPAPHRAGVNLQTGYLDLFYTGTLPENPLGRYLNLQAVLVPNTTNMSLSQLQVGDVKIPGWLLSPALELGAQQMDGRLPEFRQAWEAIEKIALSEELLSVNYRWQDDLVEQIQDRGRELLLSATDQEKIIAYYGKLSEISRGNSSRLSLGTVLQDLFMLAAERSHNNAEAVAENRALLLVLGMQVQGTKLDNVVEHQASLPPPLAPMRLKLLGRRDLPKHFALSAALAVGGGSGFADAVGVFKELSDAQGGSGFSFPDLLADRAGVVFAEVATGPQALRLQETMSRDSRESRFMPQIDQLPEGLQKQEFKQRYQDLDSATYALVKEEVERRISALPLYQQLPGEGWL